LYFKTVHVFYHNFIKKIAVYIWVNLLSKLIFDFFVAFVFHKLIMSIYNTILAAVRFAYYKLILQVYYFLKQQIYYQLVLKVYHKIIKPLYTTIKYDVILKLYYSVLYPGYHRLASATKNFLRYSLRHGILMTYFKIYGFLYDCATFTYRIFKLYLLYPVFKIYWFTKFQYNKRIKKNLTNG
jgi:hypothetical protein